MIESQDEMNTRIKARKEKAEAWICPDCGEKLIQCSAKLMHPDYSEETPARKCSKDGCVFICELGD